MNIQVINVVIRFWAPQLPVPGGQPRSASRPTSRCCLLMSRAVLYDPVTERRGGAGWLDPDQLPRDYQLAYCFNPGRYPALGLKVLTDSRWAGEGQAFF